MCCDVSWVGKTFINFPGVHITYLYIFNIIIPFADAKTTRMASALVSLEFWTESAGDVFLANDKKKKNNRLNLFNIICLNNALWRVRKSKKVWKKKNNTRPTDIVDRNINNSAKGME